MVSSADLSISTMKRLTTITAVATASLLLMGCQSKRDICAEYLANPRPDGDESLEYIYDYWKRLGISAEVPDTHSDGLEGIEASCETDNTST